MKTTTTEMNQAEMMSAFRAAGLTARGTCTDSCTKLEDGSYGPIVTTYGVEVTLRDAKTGNTVARAIPVGAVDVSAVVAEMRAVMAARVKATRARIRTERARS